MGDVGQSVNLADAATSTPVWIALGLLGPRGVVVARSSSLIGQLGDDVIEVAARFSSLIGQLRGDVIVVVVVQVVHVVAALGRTGSVVC